MTKSRPPRNGKQVVKLPLKTWVFYNAEICFRRLLGMWRYPIPTEGNIELMTARDALYWIYKAAYPVRRAVRGSGLEDFFAQQGRYTWSLPAGFSAESQLTLSSGGDLMDHPFLPHSKDVLYRDVEDLVFGADVTMANLECVIDSVSGNLVIKTTESAALVYTPEHFDAARGIGKKQFTFLATANNHTLDRGESGALSTVRHLQKADIAFHGINPTEADAQRATVIEKNGFKLGCISHTFGLNGRKPPEDKPWLANLSYLNRPVDAIDYSLIQKQIQYCREQRVDFVVAHLHWGLEHELYPRPEQRKTAHRLAELGVDLIVGHHPHVVQPMEAYTTQRDPERVVPIYYSLGNLINPFSDPLFRRGGIAQVRIKKGRNRAGEMRTYVEQAAMAGVFQELDLKKKKVYLVPVKSPFSGEKI